MKRHVYFTFMLVVLLLGAGTAAAQDAPRTAPHFAYAVSTTGITSTASVTIPTDFTAQGIEGNGNTTTDAVDPLHPCYNNDVGGTQPDSAGSYSIFMRVNFPGGTLHISTHGSNYDTVLSIYGGSVPSAGTFVACNDDANGFLTSQISLALPARQLTLMVSRFGTDVTANPLDLTFSVSYTPDGPIPPNDAQVNATPITTGVALTQTGIHHATEDAAELLLDNDCKIANSVWYRFQAPMTGAYVFTTHGSRVFHNVSTLTFGTRIAVYQATALLDCSSSAPHAAVTRPIPIQAGQEVLLRVGTSSNRNLMPASEYRIRAVATYLELLTNVSFDGNATGWKTKQFVSGDGYDGTNDGVFIAGGATKKKLFQTRAVFPSYVKWVKGATIFFHGRYAYTVTQPGGKFMLTVSYSDGTPPTVVNIPIKTTVHAAFYQPVTLASSKVASVKVMATVNPGPSANGILVRTLGADYSRDPIESRAAQSVLPLPLPLGPTR